MSYSATNVVTLVVVALTVAGSACRREYRPPPQKPTPPTLEVSVPPGEISPTREGAVSFGEIAVPTGMTAVAFVGTVTAEDEYGPTFVAFEETRKGDIIVNVATGVACFDYNPGDRNPGKTYRVVVDALPKPGAHRVVVSLGPGKFLATGTVRVPANSTTREK